MSDLCTVHQMEDCPACMRNEIDRLRALLRKSHQNCLAMWEALEGGPSPRCRDCADFNGRCQGKGKACEPQERAMEQIKLLRSSVEELTSKNRGLILASANKDRALEDAAQRLEARGHKFGAEMARSALPSTE